MVVHYYRRPPFILGEKGRRDLSLTRRRSYHVAVTVHDPRDRLLAQVPPQLQLAGGEGRAVHAHGAQLWYRAPGAAGVRFGQITSGGQRAIWEAPNHANAYALREVSGFNSLLKLYDTEATAVAAFA